MCASCLPAFKRTLCVLWICNHIVCRIELCLYLLHGLLAQSLSNEQCMNGILVLWPIGGLSFYLHQILPPFFFSVVAVQVFFYCRSSSIKTRFSQGPGLWPSGKHGLSVSYWPGFDPRLLRTSLKEAAEWCPLV
jgi:hypothetical protein